MKKIAYILVLLSISITAQQTQWEKTFGGTYADYLYDAIPTLDYGFIMVGGSLSDNTGDVGVSQGNYDYFITKITEFGNLEWSTTFGGNGIDMLTCIDNTLDGGFIVAGYSNSTKNLDGTITTIGNKDITVFKLDIHGEITWKKTLGGLADDIPMDILKTKDGGYLLAGTSDSDSDIENTDLLKDASVVLKDTDCKGSLDYWLVKLDIFGNFVWQKSFGGRYTDTLHKVIELSDSSILLAGSSNSVMEKDKHTINKGLSDWWLIKLNLDGTVIWEKSFGNVGNDELTAVVETLDNKILLGGSFSNVSEEGTSDLDIAVKKIDLDGTVLWENTYDTGDRDILTDISLNKDGSFLLSGFIGSTIKNSASGKLQANTKKGVDDFYVLKISDTGEELWEKSIGTDKKEILNKSIQTRDGGYVLMGSSMPVLPKDANDVNFYIVKLLDKDKPKVKKLPLEAIPNPTFAYTQIVIGDSYKNGKVWVVDYAGRILQNFAIDGKRIVPVNLANYPDGVYIVKVETNQATNDVKVAKISK